MKNSKLIFGVILIAVVVGVILIVGQKGARKAPAKPGMPAKAVKAAAPAPAKKAITKGKGVLTVKMLDSKGKEMPLRLRAFKALDSRSSVYAAALTANRAQELFPGTYDIEIDTLPQVIHKAVSVSEGRENLADLGRITGAVNVKATNSKGKDASYPVRVLHPRSEEAVATAVTNRAIEVIPGVYDIDITTVPRQLKRDVRISAGKEELIGLGNIIGSLFVKALDENSKEARYGVRVLKSDSGEVVTTVLANRPIEIVEGTYDVEISSTPRQVKKSVKVPAGSETGVEFKVEAPKAPLPAPAPARAKK